MKPKTCTYDSGLCSWVDYWLSEFFSEDRLMIVMATGLIIFSLVTNSMKLVMWGSSQSLCKNTVESACTRRLQESMDSCSGHHKIMEMM